MQATYTNKQKQYVRNYNNATYTVSDWRGLCIEEMQQGKIPISCCQPGQFKFILCDSPRLPATQPTHIL